MCRWNNYENRSIFSNDMDKSVVSPFFDSLCIYTMPSVALCCLTWTSFIEVTDRTDNGSWSEQCSISWSQVICRRCITANDFRQFSHAVSVSWWHALHESHLKARYRMSVFFANVVTSFLVPSLYAYSCRRVVWRFDPSTLWQTLLWSPKTVDWWWCEKNAHTRNAYRTILLLTGHRLTPLGTRDSAMP